MLVPKSRAVAALVTAVLLCAGCATTTGSDGGSRPLSPAQMKQQSKPG